MRSDITPWTIRGMGLALGAITVYALVQLGIAAGGVLLLLFIAVLLAAALEPIVGWLRDRLGIGRGWTILVVYLVFFVAVLGLAFIVVPAAIGQAQQIIAELPAFFDAARQRCPARSRR
jgi:predicted PurR-regulated permease PerM